MRAARVVLGALGVAVTVYGLWRLLALGPDQVPAVLTWVVGGIVAHDALIAPLVVLVGVTVAARAPGWLRTPLLWVVVVLGPLTLVAVPVLGRFGAKADNPTLLDRPYGLGFALVVTLVLAAAAGAAALRRSRARVPAGARPDRA